MEIQSQLGNTVIMITHDVDEAVLLSDPIVMMTDGPAATIGEVLDVKLTRPRDWLALAEDPEFFHYRQQVLQFLYEKQKNPTDTDSGSSDTAELSKSSTSVTTEQNKSDNLSPTEVVTLKETATQGGKETAAA